MSAYRFEFVRALDVKREGINELALSRDSKKLAIGFSDGHVIVYNLENKHARGIASQRGAVVCNLMVAFSPDATGRYLLTPGDGDSDFRIFDLESDSHRVIDVGSLIECLAITADGKTIVTGDDAYLVKTWDFDSGECKKTCCGHHKFVDVVLPVDDAGEHILSAAKNHVILWNGSDIVWGVRFKDYFGDITCFELTSDQKQCLCGTIRGEISLFDMADGKELWRVDNDNHIWDLALMTNGATLLVANDMGLSLRHLYRDDEPDYFDWDNTTTEIVSMAMSADAEKLVTANYEGAVTFWRVSLIEMKRARGGLAPPPNPPLGNK